VEWRLQVAPTWQRGLETEPRSFTPWLGPLPLVPFRRDERDEERHDSDRRTSKRAGPVAKPGPVVPAPTQPSRERAQVSRERASAPAPCPLRHPKPSTSSVKSRRLLQFLCRDL
jgi:hypothetical protein